MAAHFTLVHWPYTWASARDELSGERDVDTRNQYDAALARLDRQFGDFLSLLEKRGALANAIVVVLSDHGESLGEAPSVADYGGSVHGPDAIQVYGHGTNLFAAGQYRVLLAMRSYGTTKVPTPAGQSMAAPSTLEDLAPTIADAFDLEPERPFDGRSLLPALRGAEPAASAFERIRFMETEFNPPGFTPGDIMNESALLGGAKYYRIDPETDRVLVRSQFLEQVLSNRQYAASRAGRLLASVPSDDQRAQHLVFAVDGASATWLSEPPDAVDDPAAFELWTALSSRFESVRERPVTLPRRRAE